MNTSTLNKNMDSVKFIRFWFPAILYSGIIFCVSAIPKLPLPLDDFSLDKFFHFFEYIPFGYFVTRALIKTSEKPLNKKVWLLALGITFLYALSDEYHQLLVGRRADVVDLMFDVAGGLAGCWAYQRKLNDAN